MDWLYASLIFRVLGEDNGLKVKGLQKMALSVKKITPIQKGKQEQAFLSYFSLKRIMPIITGFSEYRNLS